MTDPTFYGGDLESAVFIQWTESQGHLSGQYQTAYIADRFAGRVEGANYSFTGIRNRSEVSLVFGGLLGASSTMTGRLQGSQLSLTIPDNAGTMKTLILKSGTVDDYNRLVVSIRRRAQQIAEAVARRRAVLETYQRTVTLYQRLDDATARLLRITKFDDILRSCAANERRMLAENDKLHQDANRQPLRCYQLGQVHADLGSMQATMGSIGADNGRFDYDRGLVQNSIADVRRTSEALHQSFQAFQRALATDPTVSAPPNFTQDVESKITQLLRAAAEQVQSSAKTLEDAQTRSNDFNERGKRSLDDAKEYVSGLTCDD